jgi:hypothetical protein
MGSTCGTKPSLSSLFNWLSALSRLSLAVVDFFFPDGNVRFPQVASTFANLQGMHGPSGSSGSVSQYP